MSKSRVYGWYKTFKESREDVSDSPRAGPPATATNDENVDEFKKLMQDSNHHLSVRQISRKLNISRTRFKFTHVTCVQQKRQQNEITREIIQWSKTYYKFEVNKFFV